jgi:hypothetical protein
MRTALERRLTALEKVEATENTRVIWIGVLRATKDAEPVLDSNVMGVHSMNSKVTRLDGETVEELKVRAMKLSPATCVWMVSYADRESSCSVFGRCEEIHA